LQLKTQANRKKKKRKIQARKKKLGGKKGQEEKRMETGANWDSEPGEKKSTSRRESCVTRAERERRGPLGSKS